MLALAMVPGSLGVARAGMISTQQAVTELNLAAERQKISDYMSRADVQAQLVGFGVDPANASVRLASLSDHEVQNLAKQIEASTAGAGPIYGILSLVLVVLLIIYLVQRI